MRLRCNQCHQELELHARQLECPRCADLLELVPEPLAWDPADLKRTWSKRRASTELRDQSGVWRFREFLPDYPQDEIVSLGEGNSPVLRGQRSADYAGLRNLWFKHLGWNPTGCF